MVTLLLQRAPDRRLGDAVAGRQLGHRLARGVTLGDLAALADVELGLVAELLAFGLGAIDAGLAALADQRSLEFGNTGHDRDRQPADVSRRIAPAFA